MLRMCEWTTIDWGLVICHTKIVGIDNHPFMCLLFQRMHNHVYASYVIPPHRQNIISWNPSSCKTRTYLLYIDRIMGADFPATQGARSSATIIFTVLNRVHSVPARQGFTKSECSRHYSVAGWSYWIFPSGIATCCSHKGCFAVSSVHWHVSIYPSIWTMEAAASATRLISHMMCLVQSDWHQHIVNKN